MSCRNQSVRSSYVLLSEASNLSCAVEGGECARRTSSVSALLGARSYHKVKSVGTSEIALGQKGTGFLLGKGHLLACASGEPDLIYAQVPFISDEEIADLVSIIKNSDCI